MAAVQLQLGHVLAGLAVRGRKPQRQRLIDYLAARRIAHARDRRLARLGHAADHFSSATPRPGPETRTTAIAAGGRPEERAKMVERSVATVELKQSSVARRGYQH